MAEQVTGGSNPNSPKKELPMEVRLLLAFLLMGVVMFVTQYLYKPEPQPAAKKATPTASAPASSEPQQIKPPTEAASAAPAPAPSATREVTLPPVVIDNGLYKVALSNQGATVRSWLLKKITDEKKKPLELVNTAASGPMPFSLYFPGTKPGVDVNWTWYEQTADPDGLGVSYKYTDGHVVVTKKFRFERDSYISHVTTEVTQDGKPVEHMVQWRGGFGDLAVNNASSSQRAIHFDVNANKLYQNNTGAAKNGPLKASGNFSFAGLADTYFAAVFLPQGSSQVDEVTFTDYVKTINPEQTEAKPFIGVAVSNGSVNKFDLFVGPKDVNLLSQVNPKLVQVVDFGWMSILAKPLFLIVNWMNAAYVHNYGWSIVLVTIFINFALFPLKLSSMKSMSKMQALKPQIDAINEKYRNIKMTDPRKQDQNVEVMDLYKKYGVNPVGGCVPMLLQIPFFFAFYTVFTVSVEMRGARWLWVTDLSQPETLAIRILPIVMIASQFLMQRMTPQPNTDPSQQRMMQFMPLIFGIMFYNFPSGLVLYYLTSNLVGMGQQWFFNHTNVARAAALSVEGPKKRNGKK